MRGGVATCLLASATVVVLLSVRPAGAEGADPAPLPFPVYLASRIGGLIAIDGQLTEPAWRATALGWGLSHAHEPNVLCPDPTLFRIGYDDRWLYLGLACYKRKGEADLPKRVWKPRETEFIDTQAVPRHDRERGVIPPVNTAQILIAREGRTVTLTFAPPKAPTATVHDALGERSLKLELEHAYGGGPDDELWTAEARVTWEQLGFPPPRDGDNWALNIHREIRFFSNWAFIAWRRDWGKVEYSRYDLTDRFGRLVFGGASPDGAAIESLAKRAASCRGPVRVFTTDALLLVSPDGPVVRQRYADRLKVLRAYGAELRQERQRCGNDLPYYPFFPQTQPSESINIAGRKLGGLYAVLGEKLLTDDPACGVARISHAIPEARDGLSTFRKERLYRGLPE